MSGSCASFSLPTLSHTFLVADEDAVPGWALRDRIRRPLGPPRRPTDIVSAVAAGTDRLRGVSVRVFPAIAARRTIAGRGDSRIISLDTNMLSEGLVQEAIAFLRGRIRRTPVELSPALSAIVGVPVWLKLEFLQITGSFKLRGALFKMARLTEAERRRGFVTSSAGNHGKAVAYAAKQIGVHTVVCLPKNVDEAKHRGILDLGADVRLSPFAGYDKTEDWAIAEAARDGKPFISPYDDDALIAASGGSLAAEVLEDVPDARTFFIPTGGGGLAAGFAFRALSQHSNCQIICCQHELSPGLQRSIDVGHAVKGLPAVETSAGAIEGGFGELPFQVLRDRVGLEHIAIAHVTEAEIEAAVRWMLDKHQYLIEPASAAAVAACFRNGRPKINSPAVIVLTGRNVAAKVISRILHS